MISLPLFNPEIELLFPWALLALPCALVLRLLPRRTPRIFLPSTAPLNGIGSSLRQRIRPFLIALLCASALLALSVAAARPVREERLAQERERRNLVLVLDMSRSMATVDFSSPRGTVSRIEGVKQVVSEFLRERTEDRVGIVVFGAQAFVQAPLTLDHSLLEQLATTLEVGVAGDGTAIGDGLGVGLQRLRSLDERSRAIILVTDGVNTAGHVPPRKAAEVAADLGVVIHTIGIGSSESRSIGVFGAFTAPQIGSEFDEETLRSISTETGGIYRNASSTEGLKAIYDEIDELEQMRLDEPDTIVRHELFVPWLFGGLVALLLVWLVDRWILMKLP